jgi:endo-1,4-beta-xylanase
MFVNWNSIKRRAFLQMLGASAGSTLLASKGIRQAKVQAHYASSLNRDFSVTGNTALRHRAKDKGLLYGAFAQGGYRYLSEYQRFQDCFVKECNLLVAGFYWWPIHPNEDSFNFSDTELQYQFASSNGLLFRGHPLVYHEVLPEWLTEKLEDSSVSSQEIEKIFSRHISRIVTEYAGRIHSWDVVNEAIDVYSGRTDGLRRTLWLERLGPNYIDLAFQLAAENDPQALLFYNDHGIEYDTASDEAKRVRVLKLLERLKVQGVPIHGMGIQSHLRNDLTHHFNPEKFRQFLSDIASLGLKILVTEMDFIEIGLSSEITVRDHVIAAAYEDYLSVVLDEQAVIGVITWGLSDRYTWLSYFAPRDDGLPVRPLPLDEDFNRKLAWNAIARTLAQAPKRASSTR